MDTSSLVNLYDRLDAQKKTSNTTSNFNFSESVFGRAGSLLRCVGSVAVECSLSCFVPRGILVL